MHKVIIDEIEYDVSPGRNMLEIALDNGLELPYFCWHPAMGSVGACRQCAVRVYKDENDDRGKIMMACMTPAKDGTRISINDPEAIAFRRSVIEWLMTNHPHDCPVCDEGGECHLQDMTCLTGHVYRRYAFSKRTHTDQNLGPFVSHEMNRCIQCHRCVRFYRDIAGGKDLNVFGTGNRLYYGRETDGILESEFSGNLVEVCPTGVFTDKPYGKHFTRKWDLETAPSICMHCALGCNTIPGARYGLLRRVRARFNGDVNGYFLCDRGRYGYGFVNCQKRVRDVGRRGSTSVNTIPWSDAIDAAREALNSAKRVVGIGSSRASLESNYALKKLVGDANFSTGLSKKEHASMQLALEILVNGPARTPSLAEVGDSDVVLVMGADPTNEAPMLDMAIRRAVRRAPLDISRNLKIPDWDANSVANALQDAKGKLYIAAPWRIKIEEISKESIVVPFSDVVRFGIKVADGLVNPGTNADELSSRVVLDLINARQPLVITSINAGEGVLKAAANIAWSLCANGKNCWLSIILPEANTMGVAMLGGLSVDQAVERMHSDEADTLIVLENDLTRKLDQADLDIVFSKIKNIIVLDYIATQTAEQAHLTMPVSSCFECSGTVVNSEGRAQRFFQVLGVQENIKPAWQVISEIAGMDKWISHDEVLAELAQTIPVFEPAINAAEQHGWRNRAGQKVARESHRCSGRAAKDANVTIHEPQPPVDPATPFTFSMEGTQAEVPSPLIPRFWYPGWNSVSSVNWFQTEVGGALAGGNPGKRLIEPKSGERNPLTINEEDLSIDTAPDRSRIFGSEELSSLSAAIVERMRCEQ